MRALLPGAVGLTESPVVLCMVPTPAQCCSHLGSLLGCPQPAHICRCAQSAPVCRSSGMRPCCGQDAEQPLSQLS